jgi:hypothetical protein
MTTTRVARDTTTATSTANPCCAQTRQVHRQTQQQEDDCVGHKAEVLPEVVEQASVGFGHANPSAERAVDKTRGDAGQGP